MGKLIHLASLFIALASVSLCDAAAIYGSIKAMVASEEGASEAREGYGSRRYRFLDKVDYSSLTDFVVSIDGIEKRPSSDEDRPQATVLQRDGIFEPHVLPIAVGTEVVWPNRDDIFHNVFSMSEARQFDLGYYKRQDDPKRLVFDRVGKVDVFCSIHSEMNCVILVLPNPWFSRSDRRGRYRIENVPPGTYTLKAWHERLPAKFIEVTVPENGDVHIDITMGLADLPKI